MVTRSTLAVSLVVVVLLAGCSGLVGDDGAGDPEDFEYADGFSADGVTDGTAARESYATAVQSEDSYTAEYTLDNDTGEGQTVFEATYRADFEGELGYQRFDVDDDGDESVIELYYADGEIYFRIDPSNDDETSGVEEREFNADELTVTEPIRPLLTNETEYETRVDERHGTEVAVYEASDVGNASHLYGEADADVTAFQAQFAVDSDGVIHTAEYELTVEADGETKTLTMTFELSDLGGTEVDRPAWVDEI